MQATTLGAASSPALDALLPSIDVSNGIDDDAADLLINTNGLPPGGPTVATIDAFNATAFQAQLTIDN